MAIRIDIVVVVIDRVDESLTFVHFVGMPIAPCFKWLVAVPRVILWKNPVNKKRNEQKTGVL